MHYFKSPIRPAFRLPVSLFCLILFFSSCGTSRMQQGVRTVYWVNSVKVPCTAGVMPTECLQVQKGESMTGEWTYFYSDIEGFVWEPGNLYRIEVEETRLPPDQVPADASSVRYRLVRVIEKRAVK